MTFQLWPMLKMFKESEKLTFQSNIWTSLKCSRYSPNKRMNEKILKEPEKLTKQTNESES